MWSTHTHTMEFYTAVNNEIINSIGKWLVEIITLSEVIQIRKQLLVLIGIAIFHELREMIMK